MTYTLWTSNLREKVVELFLVSEDPSSNLILYTAFISSGGSLANWKDIKKNTDIAFPEILHNRFWEAYNNLDRWLVSISTNH